MTTDDRNLLKYVVGRQQQVVHLFAAV